MEAQKGGVGLNIAGREIGASHPPLVVAEIGINHSGNFERAARMVLDAYSVGAEAVKFQCRMPEHDLSPAARTVKPSNADESVYDLFSRCALTEEQDAELKRMCELHGMIYLSTPFSRAGVDRLERLGVSAYKIGSGESRDLGFLRYVASKGKPVILSTGMSIRGEVAESVMLLDRMKADFALLHCTSSYPTTYTDVRLGLLTDMKNVYPDLPVGISDHSIGIWTSLGAVSLGASLIEKHFTSDETWDGPDIPISITPSQLHDLIVGSRAIWEARGGKKKELTEDEQRTREWYEAARAR